MKNLFLAIALFVCSAIPSFAAEIEKEYSVKPERSTCTRVYAEDSTMRTAVGGGIGAASGAVAGRLLSKKGGLWGGIIGGVAGAAIGHGTREKVYECEVILTLEGKKQMIKYVGPKEVETYYPVSIVKFTDGSLKIIPR